MLIDLLVEYKGLIWQGLTTTIKLSVIGILLSTIWGFIIGFFRNSKSEWLKIFGYYYVELFRNIPLIVQIFFIYFSFNIADVFPFLKEFARILKVEDANAFFSALLALVLYTSAYISEVVKSGLNAIPRSQIEAAASLGFTKLQMIFYIIIPQLFLIIIPALTNQYLNLIKNSSLAMTIGVAELTFVTQQIDAETFRGFEAATIVTILYIILTLTTSFIMSLINKWVSKNGRRTFE
ncbi:polar amino acid ABC transporter, inner membrane subunit [Thermodesulfatator indicus DSM 15286]|uniref:Polar amino acid ABC transporter, inner membrane subunit n=1 Tax=Thermodesulfatator indicus (strain DSM 15286 / JCM 11887 / CIR29812) TaxID=667014 RepID=F8ABB4_THEID|nr:amino acid ABC transporter permease [Thermodesulfatator indicus]AEH44424.1 polar amino acid ABC transporter, inner membrane subunit [Thermodesulfatator indicus DSM 15286]